ncbi:MAG: histidinol-phosphate phosphatase family protein [Cyclobacteriaceae bacterium]|jgi:histidinol-phosphate phosphatase family protein
MQAIILAGGKGTRLKDLTDEIPKPMIPIGDKPIIEHQILLLKSHNITNIKIIINHLKDPLINYLGSGENWGVHLTYFEEEQPLGTAGAFPLFSQDLEETFLVLYGDVMMDMDLDRLLDFHYKNKADATLVVHPNDHPHDSDLLEIDEIGKITAFYSKPHLPNIYYKNLVNAGLYVFNKSVIDHLPGAVKGDFGKDIFPKWIKSLNIFGYNTPEYLKDMGTLDRLTKVNEDYASGKIAKKNLRNKQRAIFLDRDGVLNEDRNLIHKPEDLVLYPNAADAVRKINSSDYLSVVVTNQSVVARNLCTIEELEYIHKKIDTELGENAAKLDNLYYCPYHPEKGYPEENPAYKKEHPWRKPSPGMLLQAAEDFNIDLKRSYIIGDRQSDIQAGKNAGTLTASVRTGHGYKGATIEPDYTFRNVLEAVNFIIDDPLIESCSHIIKSINLNKIELKMIAIGGNAQSGKSTLAKRLSLMLDELKITHSILNLDHFLLPKENRSEALGVMERFDSERISMEIPALIKGKEIKLSHYHKDPSSKVEDFNFCLKDEEVLIIDGIVALAIPEIRRIADCNVFMDQTFERYKERFYHLYNWKGFSREETDTLFANRVVDELDPIKKTRDFADLIINTI